MEESYTFEIINILFRGTHHIHNVQSEIIIESEQQSIESPISSLPIVQDEPMETSSHEFDQTMNIAQNSSDALNNQMVDNNQQHEEHVTMASDDIDEDINQNESKSDQSNDDANENSNSNHDDLSPGATNSFIQQKFFRMSVSTGSILYTTIDKFLISYPKFGINSVKYNGAQYTITNTCSLDSALFLLYYIYKSGSEKYRSLFNRSIPAVDQLLTTFDLVETKDWDIARLYWITSHSGNDRSFDFQRHIDLFATADAHVFKHLQAIQSHTIISHCESSDCPQRSITKVSSILSLP